MREKSSKGQLPASAHPMEAKTLVGHSGLLFTDILGSCPALEAVASWNGPIEQHTVAGPYMIDTITAGEDDACALVSHNHATIPRHRIVVGMAYAAGFDLDQNLALLRIPQLDFIKSEVTFAVSNNCLR
jgi:hypothetical protein